ncbi:MAG: hypothetical protein AAGU75_15670 [Bacillota bacterium]
MKKRYAVVIIGIIIVGGFGWNLYLNSHEISATRAQHIYSKYKTELNEIAQYVATDSPWDKYFTQYYPNESYENAKFLPEKIKSAMEVYFKQITKGNTGCIIKVCQSTEYFFDILPPKGANVVSFDMYVGIRGKDAESCDIQVYQYLFYSDSEKFVNQIPGFESSVKVDENWYFVTRTVI